MTLPALLLAVGLAAPGPEFAVVCDQCARWNQPHAPVHVFGNTWWVGVDGLSVVAIDTGAGIILLDGALPQSLPLVKASDTVERLASSTGDKRPDPAQAGQCAAYAAQAKASLEARLASESPPKPGGPH